MSLDYLPSLDADDLARLADGSGATAVVQALAMAQADVRLARTELIRRLVHDRAPEHDTVVSNAFAVLSATATIRPDAVQATFGSPYTGAWSARCAAALCQPELDSAQLADDLDYLTCLAGAAAVRAGAPVELVVPARDGRITLPGIGHASIDPPFAVLRVDAQGARLDVAGGHIRPIEGDPRWTTPPRFVVTVDDLTLDVSLDADDPYLFADRATGLAGWHLDTFAELLTRAWRVLVDRHRSGAAEVSLALTHVVPLTSQSDIRSSSASSKDAFGAVALTMPSDPISCAVNLVHEVQHVKLNGLLDLIDLHKTDGVARHRAPWRVDARPVAGLLHGTYAFAGVASFWREERFSTHDPRAELEFCQWRDAVRNACHNLLTSGELTAEGTAFVARLLDRADGWASEPVNTESAALVDDMESDHLAMWRLHNLRVGSDAVEGLTKAYLDGRPPEQMPIRLDVHGAAPGGLDDERQRLRLGLGPSDETASAANRAYLAGSAEAAALFREELAVDDTSAAAWAGLALAVRRAGDPRLYDRLEVTAAVCRQLWRTGTIADPQVVAAWLASRQMAGSSMSNS